MHNRHAREGGSYAIICQETDCVDFSHLFVRFGIWIIGGIGTLPTYPVFSVIFIALNGWFIYMTWNWHPKHHIKHDTASQKTDSCAANSIDETFETESKGSISASSTFSNKAVASSDLQSFTKEASVQKEQTASSNDVFTAALDRIPEHEIAVNKQNTIIRHSLCPEHMFSNVTKQTNLDHLSNFL